MNLEISIRKKIPTSFLTTTLKLSIVSHLICVIFRYFVVKLHYWCLILGPNFVQLKDLCPWGVHLGSSMKLPTRLQTYDAIQYSNRIHGFP